MWSETVTATQAQEGQEMLQMFLGQKCITKELLKIQSILKLLLNDPRFCLKTFLDKTSKALAIKEKKEPTW